jgi:hypothetical protein
MKITPYNLHRRLLLVPDQYQSSTGTHRIIAEAFDLIQSTFAPAYSGFPVELSGVGALHAAFLNESRTRRCWWSPVQKIRIRGPKMMGAAHRTLPPHRLADSYQYKTDFVSRWEPPHSCGGERLSAPLRIATSIMRFSAGHTTLKSQPVKSAPTTCRTDKASTPPHGTHPAKIQTKSSSPPRAAGNANRSS